MDCLWVLSQQDWAGCPDLGGGLKPALQETLRSRRLLRFHSYPLRDMPNTIASCSVRPDAKTR